jgi:hypothetical protein
MRRWVVLVLAALVLAGISTVAYRAWRGECGHGPAYVAHVIRPHDAAQGMGTTGTPADVGQVACVSREMKRRLDDPSAPNNRNPEPPKTVAR